MPMPGMVTPATIGWNIVSSSCRPRKYHGAFDGFGVWLKLASSSSGAFTKIEKIEREGGAGEGGDELDDEQVGPDVDLVLRRGLDVLDRAGLDDREQALGVTARAGGDRRRRAVADGGGDRRPAAARLGDRGRRRSPPALALAALRPLEQVRGDLRLAASLGGASPSPAGGVAIGGASPPPRRPRPSCGPPRLACGGVRGSRSSVSSPRPTAARRCRRPCAPARSGSP